MSRPDLRATLQAAIAGTLPPPRGNVVCDSDINAAAPFAKACRTLVRVSRERDGHPLPAPSALLPLIV